MELETYDENDTQFIIYDYSAPKWSTHYGASGSGYGYLNFTLNRQPGKQYHDIGFGYRVILRKYLNMILFDGQIRNIQEVTGGDNKIEVQCLGHVAVAQDEEFLRAFCDSRQDLWHIDSEVPAGSFRPDLFNFGRGATGIYIHPGDKAISSGDYSEIIYEFFPNEVAERFKCDLSMCLGQGTIFDATVSAIDDVNGYVDYTNDSGEGNVEGSMTLYNSTQGENVLISSIDTGANRITVGSPSSISGWASSDEIAVYGPLFSAQISDISTDTITYTGTIIGENNIAANQMLVNLTKKAVATVQSNDTGANTITVSDETHLTDWANGDQIAIPAPLFEATYSTSSGVTITYSSPIGERVVSSSTGWAIHNATKSEYATVASWSIASNQLDVTDSGDISTWVNGDVLRIYTPFRFKVLDSSDTQVWPTSDWREGAVRQNRTSINVTTTGSPTQFKMRLECYISGTANEYSFVNVNNVKTYSTESDATPETLALEAISVLSASGLDLSSEVDKVEAITNTIEPMVYEFSTVADALAEVCKYGDGSGNLLAWGVCLDDTKKLFLETQDFSKIGYVAKRDGAAQISVRGDIQASWQQVRGAYKDKNGEQAVTSWLSDSDAYFSGHFRRKTVSLDNVDTDAEATTALTIFLNENKRPKVETRYTFKEGAIRHPFGYVIHFDEVQADGTLVMIEDWRAVEAIGTESGADIRDVFTTEKIAIVEVDYKNGTVTLTPVSAEGSFERYMERLARISQI